MSPDNEHSISYVCRTLAYTKQDYKECATEMELALKGYFTALEDCEAVCYEMPSYQVDRFAQFWRSIAEMEHNTLKCKTACKSKIYAEVAHEKYEEPVEIILNYLQYSHYQNGDILEAANCAKTAQLVNPKNADMNRNVEFYTVKVKELGHKEFQGEAHFKCQGDNSFAVRHRADVVRYLYTKQQAENLELMADNFLLYEDEGNVTEAPELDQETLDQLIVDEVERQLTSDRVEASIASVKEEL